jgi:hypothetical protein
LLLVAVAVVKMEMLEMTLVALAAALEACCQALE